MDHVRTEPTPPSERTELDVPTALERILLDCLEKEPARRPASAEVSGERLAACSDGSSWTPEMARRWWSLHGPAAANVAAPLTPAREVIATRAERRVSLG